MRHHQQGGGGVPLPELLVAYADGQLDPVEQQHVEAWLAKNPDLAAEVEAHRRLAQCWRQTQAPEPGAHHWDRVLAGIKADLQTPRTPRAPWRRRLTMFWTPVAGIAAAVLLVILVPRGPNPASTPDGDLNNVKVLGRNGELLLRDRLIFATPGDIELENMEKDKDGTTPRLQPGDGSAPPILMPPLDTDQGKPSRNRKSL